MASEWVQVETLFNRLNNLEEREQAAGLGEAAKAKEFSAVVINDARLLLQTARNMGGFLEGNLRREALLAMNLRGETRP